MRGMVGRFLRVLPLALALAGCKQPVGGRCQLGSDCESGVCSLAGVCSAGGTDIIYDAALPPDAKLDAFGGFDAPPGGPPDAAGDAPLLLDAAADAPLADAQ